MFLRNSALRDGVFNLPTSASSFTLSLSLNNDYAYLPMKVNQNFSTELLPDFLNIALVFAYSSFKLNHSCARFLHHYSQYSENC